MKIVRLVPNPAGDETQDESVTIRNGTGNAIDLTGWTLRDRANRAWALSGTLAAGAEATFRREGQAMALNNGGDRVELRDAMGVIKDSVTYTRAHEGEVIVVGDVEQADGDSAPEVSYEVLCRQHHRRGLTAGRARAVSMIGEPLPFA